MPYRLSTITPCVVCKGKATQECGRCRAPLCVSHFTSICADCGATELRRKRRVDGLIGTGAAVLSVPALIAIFFSSPGWLPVLAPMLIIAVAAGLWSIPALTSRVRRTPELTKTEPVPLLPEASTAISGDDISES